MRGRALAVAGPAVLLATAFGLGLFFNGMHVPLLAVSLLAAVLALGWSVAPGVTRGWAVPGSATAAGLVVLWLFWGVSQAWSQVPYTSHLYYWWLSALPVTFFALLLAPRPRLAVRATLGLLGVGAVALAVTALVQYFGYPDTYRFRAPGPLLNPNNLAALLNLFLLPALALALTTRTPRRWWGAAALVVLLFAAVAATQSRGAAIGLAVGTVLLVAVLRAHGGFAWGRLAAVVAGCGVAFAILDGYAGEELSRRVETLGAVGAESSLQNRLLIWGSAWEMVRDHPWLGTGLGTFFLFYPRYRVPGDSSGGFYAHMDPLQFWVETGVLGPLLFYAVLTTILVRTLRAHRRRGGPDPRLWGPFAGLLAVALHTHITFNLYVLPVLIAAGAWLARWHLASETGRVGRGRRVRVRLPDSAHRGVWRGVVAGLVVLIGWDIGAAGTASWLVGQGRQALAEQRVAEGLRDFRYARALTPASDLPYALGAEVYITALRSGELDSGRSEQAYRQAQELLDQARRRNPVRARLPYLAGRLREAAPEQAGPGWQGTAETAYRRALTLDPRFLPARRALASLLQGQGRPGEALAVLEDGLPWPYPGERAVGFYLQTAELYRRAEQQTAMREVARRALRRTSNERLAQTIRRRFGLNNKDAGPRHGPTPPAGHETPATEGKI